MVNNFLWNNICMIKNRLTACYSSELSIFCIYFVDLWFRQFKPSLVAATCVAGARIRLNVFPYWSSYLTAETGHDSDQIIPVLEYLKYKCKL